jgi:Contractile injection system tube protein
MTGQLVKAMLTTTDSGATSITFQFNPTELNFKRSLKITSEQGARTSTGMPKISFAYPEPGTVTLSKLLFDTYEEGTSIFTKLDPILKAVDFTGSLKRPPLYVLAWGSKNYIKCFVTCIDYTLTMFLADGTPVRAEVTLTLQEVDDSQV